MRTRPTTIAFLVASTLLMCASAGDSPPKAILAAPSTPGLSPVAALGEQLFHDVSLSVSGRLSCQTCHRKEFAHAAPPEDLVSKGGPGMDIPGIRNSPSIRYATFTPTFGFDDEGNAFGGLFRDGRVPTLVEQAKQPFLDAREMANPSIDAVIARLRRSPNAARFRAVFGGAALDDSPQAFESLAVAIAQYERELPDFRRFDSKYDAWLAGKAVLAAQEERGLKLFEDPEKGNCAACHPSRPAADGSPPLFTDFTYDNVGLPRNASIPANADPHFQDLGLCGPERKDLAARRDLCGAFKVPTLRNVARTAPYFHNGGIRNAARGGRLLRAPRHRARRLVPEVCVGRPEVRRPAAGACRFREYDRGTLRSQGRAGRLRSRLPRLTTWLHSWGRSTMATIDRPCASIPTRWQARWRRASRRPG